MKKLLLIALILSGIQQFQAQVFTGKLNPFPKTEALKLAVTDTVKILAIMVEFQTDKDEATFGNGKFGSMYSQEYGDTIIDPLPHDRNYFMQHMKFAQNYYHKVSRGKFNISYEILPQIITVSKTMRSYSPPNNSTDLTNLGEFAKEVWHKADSVYAGYDFSQYDLFAIFHAGVGRDISLSTSYGNDKDLPSIYMSDEALSKIYGTGFAGFPVSNGSFHIDNTMILPSTESREIEVINGIYLQQLSINGLIVASIASHIGLPDLYDTETGKSAIGRFGLMDGQAIFTYGGTFPPEPSPWEKIYLGWAEPVVYNPTSQQKLITLTADLASSLSDTVILKVPVNENEYFLIENRSRDANKDGSIVTQYSSGATITSSFPKDTAGYYSYDVENLKGVITDVDEYDWAVPGNGIVIWHIDENVINEKMASNSINNDKFHRGIDVEEADGVQDIGEEFQTVFGDIVVGEGTEEDLWYQGNKAKLYPGKFTDYTSPDAKSYSGANSLVNITGLSAIGNKMSFKLAYKDSTVRLNSSYQLNLPSQADAVFTVGTSAFVLNESDLYDETSAKIADNFSEFSPVFANYETGYYVLGTYGSSITTIINYNNSSSTVVISAPSQITAPPVIQEANAVKYLLVGCGNGKIYKYTLGAFPNIALSLTDSTTMLQGEAIKQIAASGDYITAISDYGFADNTQKRTTGSQVKFIAMALTKDASGNYINIVLDSANKLDKYINGTLADAFQIISDSQIKSFAIGDIKRDGNNYIVFANGNKLEALNLAGVEADDFPFNDSYNKGFIGAPAIADFESGKNAEIIAATNDGRIFAINGATGKALTSFPLTVGSELSAAPFIYTDSEGTNLLTISQANTVSNWRIGLSEGSINWSGEYADNNNSSYVQAAGSETSQNTFFPKERTYNWPNPVFEGDTYIRYYVSENSEINIKIFDLAGDFVAELNDYANGGFDNETAWNVSNIQSGVYIARIEAKSSSGKTENASIKIAVIK